MTVLAAQKKKKNEKTMFDRFADKKKRLRDTSYRMYLILPPPLLQEINRLRR
jgi:hypothetical protein